MTPVRAALVALLAVPLVTAAPARAKPSGPACGMHSLPIMPGNSWTYTNGKAKITIRVLDVSQGQDAAGKAITRIKVEEEWAGRSKPYEWTCTPKEGLVVPPESFFFAGEPGGGVGMAFTYGGHEGVTYHVDRAITPDSGWVEKVNGEAVRNDVAGQGATHPKVKLEIERHVIVQPPGATQIELGAWNTMKIAYDLRGRATLEKETLEIPAQRTGMVWLVKDLGVIQIEDCFDKTWRLAATTLPLPRQVKVIPRPAAQPGEQPAGEKPAADKPAGEQPPEEKPADKPAVKPAEDKPATP